jgi:hypothetical protein
MKALRNNLSVGSLGKSLVNVPSKQLHKNFRPTLYNLRLYFSNSIRNEGYGRWDMVWGPDGEKVKFNLNYFKNY